MKIGKIKPTATVVAQFAAGVEVEAIQHEGKVFMPVIGLGEFATKESASEVSASAATTTKTESPISGEKPAPKKETNSESKEYTEDELMEMSVKDLSKICKELNVDPDEYEGKNTNKKLRNLILAAQAGELDSDGEEDNDESEDAKEENADGKDSLTESVGSILEDFDAGKKNKKKTIAAILALAEGADEEKVTELVDKFEEDADADLDEIAENIAKVLTAEPEEEEKPASKKSRKGKKEEKEELVSADDLEVGDRVSVWWNDDNKEWFDGTVKSIKKGKVVIAYDDDTEDAIDPKVHTKIKKLAE